ncbi:bifunctional lytic transglycosylase/C40 family peptidase [Amycolatopsis sp. SID8362]|uniref:C40 family peptidase n=1 Tax=Amycolatopsis sp. SID8362 TaxID=2690346 RepID=UPI00136B23F3|nr:bifunctional lytic transglycosylase/C40 family peptidase [Amycolatopsis sp. SID8362]NBH06026.1 transglycosylase SLT domain-containing protein [Amycolatopsis sp. SID8362]NED42724.1 transglycosylase SLT domain-containing protein [Amycolatopsis sp. SID8362]
MNPLLALRAAELAREHIRENPGRWGCLAALLLFGPPAACVVVVVFLFTALSGASGQSAASAPGPGAVADIPADYLVLYREAARTCPGLDWSILAAIGKIETDHGRSKLPGVHSGMNSAKAGGPMQFLQSTFDSVVARHPIPPGGAHPPSRYNPHDAIYAAAAYLCDSGARDGRDLHGAIFAYNHAEWYVRKVLDQAQKYNCGAVQAPSRAAQAAITFACAQLGLPYVWGGDGPGNGDRGFDCSGLTKAAYATAGIDLPRTAQTQYNAGPRIAVTGIRPGDLVFFGTSTGHVTHVGLALASDTMVNAPDFGTPVRVDSIRRALGATRPADS